MGCSAEPHLRRGAPSEEILSAASAYEADLIVMGTAGRSGLSRLLHPGSTAERVIRGSRLPVTVVPPDSDEVE